MEQFQAFDYREGTEFVAVRQNFAKPLLEDLRTKLQISTAVDMGCGVGYFSIFLRDLGFRVTGIDGRQENVEECKRRYPDITFWQANAEDLNAEEVGIFDLVFCFGLLYHLENPFRAIRNLHALTRHVLLIESMCAPGVSPIMELLDENKQINQGLDYVAFYPTESCLIKMLYRAGFPSVYGFTSLPPHEEFLETPTQRKRRTMLIASRSGLTTSGISLIREPVRAWDIWTTSPYQRIIDFAGRMLNGARGFSKRG